jgi:hypothetical protein
MAILSGVSNNYGTVIQKKVVNMFLDEQKFFRNLVKNPTWLFGLVLQNGIGAIFFMIAQIFIGPTLIPGLMAAGLIVLAVGSIKIIGEHLKPSEMIGIFIMIAAITLLGFSNMSIDLSIQDLTNLNFFMRIIIFTAVLYSIAGLFYVFQSKNFHQGISLAVYSGFQFALSNFWISPLMIVIVKVFTGTASIIEYITFIMSLIILIATNIFGISSLQKAFKKGQASNLIPIQQVPIQIAPPFYYLAVFLLPIPNLLSIIFLSMGIILVMFSSFLLGKRQAQLEKIE